MAHPPIGIDLGTTFSGLAAINAAGRPEIVSNSDGEKATASAVYFQEGGDILIGEHAVGAAAAYPERVVRWVKRQIGDSDWGFGVDGSFYSAIQISGMILQKVKQDAEKTLGPIESAVVTVPAYFEETRRRATIAAAKMAGLEVLRIINEPTAAAIAYASSSGSPGTILVYDFGGGTFDASIVRIKSELEVEVIASDGDHDLGGYHLDQLLVNHCNSQLQKEKGGVAIEEGSAEWHGLMRDSERGKRSLSTLSAVKVGIPWGGHLVNVDLDRDNFEKMASEYILRTQMLVENVLMEANLRPEDIDDVLLVGGSTRIPAVREMLTKKFGRAPIESINPDDAVALGAAIQAGAIMQERGVCTLPPQAAGRMTRTRIRDVAPHSFGTIVVENTHGVERERNAILIRKNAILPAKVKETFYTMRPSQKIITCTVTQGEDTDPNFVITKNNSEMPLPPNLPVSSPIEIEYSYDVNGCMECVFKEPSSGKSQKFQLDGLGVDEARVDGGRVDFDDLAIS